MEWAVSLPPNARGYSREANVDKPEEEANECEWWELVPVSKEVREREARSWSMVDSRRRRSRSTAEEGMGEALFIVGECRDGGE